MRSTLALAPSAADDFLLHRLGIPRYRLAAFLAISDQPSQSIALDPSVGFPFLHDAQRFANDLAGVVVVAALDLGFHKAFELWRERNVHGLPLCQTIAKFGISQSS